MRPPHINRTQRRHNRREIRPGKITIVNKKPHAESSGGSVVELLPAALSDPVCGGLPDRFMGLTGHTESIAEVGPGVTVLASGPT